MGMKAMRYICVIWLVFVIIFLALVSCEDIEFKVHDDEFVIKAGQHDSKWILEDTGPQVVTDVTFDESCIYDLQNENQHDWNKLIGLTYYAHSKVHDYSCRIVWRWNLDNGLELGWYVYEGGVRMDPGRTGWYFRPGEQIRCYIIDRGTHWQVYAGNGSGEYYRQIHKQSRNLKNYKVLTPYFGGDATAPHDITIDVNFVTTER
jgi:hypothetical protein